jgi:hypothetical protein
MGNSSKELLAKLKTSLPAAESSRELPVLHNFTASRPQRVPKLSVSLYSNDLERLDDIREHMRKSGVRTLTDSEAIRLACRRAELDSKMVSIYHDMQLEDGRKKAR